MVAGGGAATIIVGAGSGATGHDQDSQNLVDGHGVRARYGRTPYNFFFRQSC